MLIPTVSYIAAILTQAPTTVLSVKWPSFENSQIILNNHQEINKTM